MPGWWCYAGMPGPGKRYRDRYRDGEGVPQDFARVASLYEQACDGGEPLACNNLGVRYHRGGGVVRDMDRAVGLYQQACDGGAMPGCINLANRYRSGGTRNLARAADFHEEV
ncbi:MAG: hypothetical protein Ct9H300mP15_13090 [Gemmatimonadota bacterium]|nr:MAG: hypothetical protein Ct9H300mP15_13090 [Gemmatimonadota bacterium]